MTQVIDAPRADPARGERGIGMDGLIARWYDKITRRDLEVYRQDAQRAAERTPVGGTVLDLAPGPGYLAIELAKLGRYQVFGLDISRTFVEIATKNAQRAGVAVEFRHGDASEIPFPDATFDTVVCRAAFKNFANPVRALREAHRVLKPGGTGLILDLNRAVPRQTLDAYVREYVRKGRMNRLDAFLMPLIFRHLLMKRAYTRADFERMLAAAGLPRYEIQEEEISLLVWLSK